jgi:hypothetical protein
LQKRKFKNIRLFNDFVNEFLWIKTNTTNE